MKKALITLLSIALVLSSLAACTPVDVEDDSSATILSQDQSMDSSMESSGASSDDVPPQSSSVADESKEPAEYTPIYSEDYTERVAYYKNYELNADVNDAYFNNSVFVGNSIMAHYKNFITKKRASVNGLLGNAGFFAAASFSFYNNKNQTASSKDCALPMYQGQYLHIDEAVGKMGAQTVYLSLMALNDIALYKDGTTGIDETYKLVVELIEDLATKYPTVDVVVIGNTYLHYSSNSMKKLNNGTIHTLNTKVLDYCNENGVDFVDVAYALIDDKGCLGTEFCSDVGSNAACHLNDSAYNAWTEQLRDYAKKKQAGNWANPTSLKGLNKN